MERRRAANGQAYTFEEFRFWYHADARTFWDKAQTEYAAWTRANGEQAAALPAAEQRQAAGAPAEALEIPRETGDVDQKYRDQLLGAYNFLTAAVRTVD